MGAPLDVVEVEDPEVEVEVEVVEVEVEVPEELVDEDPPVPLELGMGSTTALPPQATTKATVHRRARFIAAGYTHWLVWAHPRRSPERTPGRRGYRSSAQIP